MLVKINIKKINNKIIIVLLMNNNKTNETFSDNSMSGGLQEWSADHGIDEDEKKDEAAKAAAMAAEEEEVCVPIGEGENCW